MDENLIAEPKFNFLRNTVIVFLVLFAILILLLWSKGGTQTVQQTGDQVGVSGANGINVTQDVDGGFVISLGIECADDEIIQWDDVADQWVCASDDIGTNITPPTCFGTDKLVWTGTAYQCATDITGTALIPIQCLVTEKLMWDGSGYICSTDLNTAGITPPTCLPTEKLLWNGATYVCAIDDVGIPTINTDNQTLSILGNNLSIFGGNTVALPTDVYTSNNGITQVGNNFSLGGTLLGNTTINTGGFNLNLTGAGGLGVASGITTLNSVAYQWPNADGGAGEVLATDGAGNLSWATVVGGGIINLNGEAGVIQFFANDSNVTITSAANTHTLGWTGLLPINRGGTNSNAVPTAGAIAYGDGTSYQFTAVGAPGEVLTSNGAGVPTWTAATTFTVTTVTPGAGLVGALPLGPGAITLDVQARNGLSVNADFVELGGTLIQNTTITNNGFDLIFNGTGNGSNKIATFAGDVDIQGVIDPTAILFSDSGVGSYNPVTGNGYRIGVTGATQRPIYVSPLTNNAEVFSVRNAANTVTVFDVDTLNTRVGINAGAAPTSTLHVVATETTGVGALYNANSVTSGVGMRLNVNAMNTGAGLQILGNSVTSGDLLLIDTTSSGNFGGNGAIDFGASGSHTGTYFTVRDVANDHDGNVMRIDSSGDIGTVLGVVSNRTTTGTLLSVTTNSLALNSTLGVINLANTGTSTNGIFARFQSSGTAGSGMTILGNGNVGIGTTTPALQLNLAAVGAQTGLQMNGVATISGPAVSPASTGRIFFDSTLNRFQCSENTSAYSNCFTGGTLTAANNGLSVTGTTAQLGNDVGGTAAQLLNNREIPLNGFDINYSVGGVARSQIEDDGSVRSFMDYNVVGDFIQSGTNLGISGNNMRLTTNQLNFVTPAISSSAQPTTWNSGGQSLTFTSAAGNNLLLRPGTTGTGQGSYEFTAATGGNAIGSRRGTSLVYNAGTIVAGIDEIGQHILMNDSRVLTGNVFGQVLNVTGGTNVASTRIGSEIINNENSEFIRFTDNTNTDSSSLFTGNQNPETVVSAQLGSIFLDNANGTAYIKNANDGGNTGWLALLTGAAGSPCPGSTTVFCQNGNSFGANGVLGTNDLFSLAFETNGITRALFDTNGHFVPNLDDTYDLGSTTNRWRDLYLGPSTINIGSNANNYGISYDTGSSSLVFNEDGVARNFRVETVADVNSIFVNGTTGTTGIGTTAGVYQMTVSDNGGSLSLLVTSGGGDSIFAQGGSLGNTFTSRNNNLGVHHLNSINGARLALGADSGASTTKETFTIISNGFVGIGAQPGGTGFPVTPSNPLDLHTQDNNSNLFRAFAITRIDADSVASDGIATGMLFRLEGNGGNTGNVGAIDVFLDDSDNILPNSSMRFTTVIDGVFTERMRISDVGNVGIGNSTAPERLTVGDGVSAIQRVAIDAGTQTHLLFKQGGSNQWGISNSDSLPGLFSIYDYSGGGDAFSIEAGGFVGIGNTNPGVRFHVGSNAIPIATTVARFENAGGTCDVTPNIAGGITCTSDERFKTNVQEFNGALNLINQIDVKSYNLINGGTYQVGVIAQGLEQILPDLVKTNEDGYKSVSYSGLTPYLVSAVQEQQELIETSEESIINLQGDIVNLQNSQNLISVTDFQTLSVDFAALSLEVTELENNITITNAALQNEIDIIKTQIADFVTVTSLSTGAVTTIQVNDLTVANSLNILGTVTVASAATFNGNVVVASNLNVLGKLTLGNDNSGEVVIPAGLDLFEVVYSTPYPIKPIVVVSPRGEAALNDSFGYTIVNETSNGFTIKLKALLLEDVTFNWIVVGK